MWRDWNRYVLFGCVLGMLLPGTRPITAIAQEPDSLAVVATIERTLVDAISKAEQSVVSIARIKRHGNAIASDLPAPIPNPFNRNRIPAVDFDDPTNLDFIPTDFGSGVVIGVDPASVSPRRTYILTNYHVVKGGARTIPDDAHPDDFRLYVRVANRRGFDATIFAADPRSDLAVITVPDADLKPIKFGDGSKLKKGQLVIALGNPYALARDGSASASWGMVSNLRRRPAVPRDVADMEKRTRETLHDLGDLIQVDTRLNLGTSGGALINLKGELVGLTTSLAALAGFEKSSGFATPIDSTTMRVIQSLREGKEVEYGFLGVSFGLNPFFENRGSPLDPLTPGSALPEGAVVQEVIKGGPAERAGLLPNDIILNVNGERVFTRDDLTREINKLGPEARTRITVWRQGEIGNNTATLDVMLSKWGAFDEDSIVATNYRQPPWRGFVIDYSTARNKHNGDLIKIPPIFPEGVLILKILTPLNNGQPDLSEGSRIYKVNKKPVSTPAEFHDAVKDLRGDVTLEVDDGIEKDRDGKDLKDRDGRDVIKFKQVIIHE